MSNNFFSFRQILTYLLLIYFAYELLFIDKVGIPTFLILTLVAIVGTALIKYFFRNSNEEKKQIVHYLILFSLLLIVLLMSALNIF